MRLSLVFKARKGDSEDWSHICVCPEHWAKHLRVTNTPLLTLPRCTVAVTREHVPLPQACELLLVTASRYSVLTL